MNPAPQQPVGPAALAVLVEEVMTAASAHPELRKVIKAARKALRKKVSTAILPRLHTQRPSAEEVEARLEALAMAERVLREPTGSPG